MPLIHIPQQDPMPAWYTQQEPIYKVTSECVLQWPDEKNAQELRVICPVHGTLSIPYNEKDKSNGCTCGKNKNAPKTQHSSDDLLNDKPLKGSLGEELANNRHALGIKNALRRVWNAHDSLNKVSNYPDFLRGSAADRNEVRLDTVFGKSVAYTPRRPCIVNSHSLRAVSESRALQAKREDYASTNFAAAYMYLKSLGFNKELRNIYVSQLRRCLPDRFTQRMNFKEILLERRETIDKDNGLILNFYYPTNSWFVQYIDYSKFMTLPDIHVGDQVLELKHGRLDSSFSDFINTECFHIKLRPCPFISWLNLTVGNCPVLDEAIISASGLNRLAISAAKINSSSTAKAHEQRLLSKQLQSNRDLGFTIIDGRVVNVLTKSPAEQAGLQPDDKIIEVDNTCCVNLTGPQIITLIRRRLTLNSQHSVTIGVMPQRFYDQLLSLNDPCIVCCNKGFNLNEWLNGRVFGVRRKTYTEE